MTSLRAKRLWLIALLAIVGGVGVFRAPILTDDRVWYDEYAVLLQGHGVWNVPWPEAFDRPSVLPPANIGDVLRVVRSGAYPPGIPLAVHAVGGRHDMIRVLRWGAYGLGLLLVLVAAFVARAGGGPIGSLCAAAYVGSSVLLTHLSQQIKWSAAAPLLGLAASGLLLWLHERDSLWLRGAYALCIALMLHAHYFCLWVLPAHGLYVLLLHRRLLWRWSTAALLGAAAAAPWYLWALPRQIAFVRGHFVHVASRHVDSWNTPIGTGSALRAMGYDMLAALGLQTDVGRAGLLVPALAVAFLLLRAGLRSAAPERRRVVTLATITLLVAGIAHLAYAARVGNVVPLQPIYLSHWFPLLMIAVVLGSLDARPWLRIAGLGLIGGLSLTSVTLNPTASQVATSQTPRDMASLCRAVLERLGGEAVVLHRDDFEAKLLNLGCPIPGRQATNPAVVPRGAPVVVVRACATPSRD